MSSALHHGGNLHDMATRYGIAASQWLDLSTGISPWSWPVPQLPSEIWQRLPELHGLMNAANSYYQCQHVQLVPVAGSQVAIRQIPRAIATSSVAIPRVGYQEHGYSWQLAGHRVVYYQTWQELNQLVGLGNAKHVVVINPNNPTADQFSPPQLQQLKDNMASDATLLIDEAFMDVQPSHSSIAQADQGTIILRSVGKFFGLAGLRLGFAMGKHPALNALSRSCQPWPVSSPAVWVCERALQDQHWQQQQRQRITQAADTLFALVQSVFKQQVCVNGGLFVTVFGCAKHLQACFEAAAQQAILLRYGDIDGESAWLRIGLSASGYDTLRHVLHQVTYDYS